MSLLLVAILPAFAAVVIGFDGIPGIVTTCLLITPVVLAIMKRIKGILLAYAVGAGTVLAARTLIALIDGRVSYHGVRDQFPFLSSHTDTQAMISATIAASVLSIIVFVTVNYGTRVTKLVANIFFRSLAVWLLVFFSSTALFVIKNAEQQAQDKTYNETLAAYAQRNLDDSVPVYKIVLPDSYYQNSVQVDGAGSNYEEYFLRYRSNVNGYADVIIKVSQDKLPSSCKNTMTPQAQQDTASGTVFSCNIILATDDGKKVYGYRDLSDLDFRGFGPPKFTVQQLQQVSPERFYLQDGGSLVELYYDGLAYADPGLLDFSAVKNFASGLHEVDASARQDFINRYIKQSKQLKPVRSYMERDDHQAWIILAAAIAIYMALLFWALENIFEKAGHSYWEAYIPIVNLWVLVKIAGYPGWWSLITYLPTINNFGFAMMFATVIPFIAQLLFLVTILDIVLLIVVGLSIAGKFGRSKWFGILLIIPPLPGYLILGFDKSKYGDAFDRTVSTTSRNELNPPSVNA